MSNFYCVCGFNMKDSTDNLPYKAYFLPDEDVNRALDDLLRRAAEFIEARERGEQEQYLKEHALFPREPTLQDVLANLLLHPTFEFGRTMYACEECGRIWVQARPHKNEWVSYSPETARGWRMWPWWRPKRGILSHEGMGSGE
jgi:hypothetical protein